MPPLDLYARVRIFLCILHTRPRVQRAPGFPCALFCQEGRKLRQSSGASRREDAESHPQRCLTRETFAIWLFSTRRMGGATCPP
jgi:hypothetical protein